MKDYFGTDGIRGEANRDLTAELALAVGRAAARAFGEGGCRAVIGRDTRISGQMLESALLAGFLSEGAEVVLLGVLPTPAVAHLTEDLEVDLGVVISASHNPYRDNGIKFFGSGGTKLSDDLERAIESELKEAGVGGGGAPVGAASRLPDAEERYIGHLISCAGFGLEGLRVAVDCANGAAFRTCPGVFQRLGAGVEAIGVEPDGMNINSGVGSTHPERLCELVKSYRADVGFALDGDADRCICVDESGTVRDGDYIMAVAARYLMERGLLHPPLVVSTVMSNLGFYRALEDLGIRFVQTGVGDRNVFEEMKRSGALLGGEQSGHIIFREHATTGDGTLTALMVAGIMRETGEPLSELSRFMKKYPQVLVNVRSKSGRRLAPGMAVWDLVRAHEERLGGEGRVLVRSSGTEPVERIMVEAPTHEEAERIAGDIAEAVSRELDG